MEDKENGMKAQTSVLFGIASALLGLSALLNQISESVVPQESGQDAMSAAHERSYVFALFHEDGDVTELTIWQTLQAALAKRPGQAIAVNIRVNDPAMKTLVDRYGVNLSRLPLVLAIAPNDAVTGAFVAEMTEQDVAGAFVSPAQADCMKQEQTRQFVALSLAPTTAPWPTVLTWYWLTSRTATPNPTIVSRCRSCIKSSAAREEPSPMDDHCLLADKRSCLDENPLDLCPWPVCTRARRMDTIRTERGAN
jgi:hypothetical protein